MVEVYCGKFQILYNAQNSLGRPFHILSEFIILHNIPPTKLLTYVWNPWKFSAIERTKVDSTKLFYKTCWLTHQAITWTDVDNHYWGVFLAFTWWQSHKKFQDIYHWYQFEKISIKDYSRICQEPMSKIVSWVIWLISICVLATTSNECRFRDFIVIYAFQNQIKVVKTLWWKFEVKFWFHCWVIRMKIFIKQCGLTQMIW